MNLRSVRIGTRLRLGFGAILALLVAVLVTDTVVGMENRDDLLAGLKAASAKVELTTTMKGAQLEGVVAIRSIGLHTDVSAMNQEEERFKLQRQKFAQAHDQLVAMGITPAAEQLFANIDRLNRELERPTTEAISQALAFNPEAVAKLISTRIDPVYWQVLAEINKLVDLQKTEENQLIDAAVASGHRLMVLLSCIGLCAVLAGVILTHRITHSITRPLDDAVTASKRVAAGDLTYRMAVSAGDETGQLLHALNGMNDSLVRIVSEVRMGTDTIASASAQIASGNLDLSARTEQQASSLEQTAASMDALTTTVKQNAEHALEANQLVQSASGVAQRGRAVVSQVVNTMGSIHASSQKISDIIAVIDGIAFQTNILALNAAVEAARAGEQGRGFAVVASEVRALAGRSAQAAKEIKTLIEDSVQQVNTGAQLASDAGATMGDIVASVERVTCIMSEITAASQEQTTGIEQINQAITHMDGVTQQNAALVEQAAAAAAALQSQAAHLAQVVSVFQLDEAQEPLKVSPAPGTSTEIRFRRAENRVTGVPRKLIGWGQS